MMTYEYELIKMNPVATDSDEVQEILNEKGLEGFRFVSIQKLWTRDDYGQEIQRNFLILEKAEEQL